MIEVPFNDLKRQHAALKLPLSNLFEEILENSQFIKGGYVATFEHEFGDKFGYDNVISCANGTDALYVGLRALEIGPGDEVIVPCNSWYSTSSVVVQLGATPVFVDVDPLTFNMSIETMRNALTPKTKAVICVHLYGRSCEMESITVFCKEANLFLIEDCAQAVSCKYNERYVGKFGDLATFSFFPGKNLGCMGDGGAIVSGCSEIASKIRLICHHGSKDKKHVELHGQNSRLDGLQAGILSIKLKNLDGYTERRRKIACKYDRNLSGLSDIRLPELPRQDDEHVWHLYVIQTEERNSLRNYLDRHGINTAIQYPIFAPFQFAYKAYGYDKKSLPVGSKLQEKILSLPIFPEMTDEECDYVCEHVTKYFCK